MFKKFFKSNKNSLTAAQPLKHNKNKNSKNVNNVVDVMKPTVNTTLNDSDKFFSKIYYRLIKNFDPGIFSYNSFFNELFNREELLFGAELKHYFYDKRDETEKFLNENDSHFGRYGYMMPKDFIFGETFETILNIMD